MKRILYPGVLAAALLFSVAAKSNSLNFKQILIALEGWALECSSDSKSGAINNISIYDANTGNMMLQQKCGGYRCSVDVSSLPAADYEVVVTTANDKSVVDMTL